MESPALRYHQQRPATSQNDPSSHSLLSQLHPVSCARAALIFGPVGNRCAPDALNAERAGLQRHGESPQVPKQHPISSRTCFELPFEQCLLHMAKDAHAMVGNFVEMTPLKGNIMREGHM
eukprot:741634-Amphidinium_carterae.1